MSILQFANNAAAVLGAPTPASGAGSTTITLSSGQGALFPAVGANQSFYATLRQAANLSVNEIVLVTARATDVLTVLRAQDGTSAINWGTNDKFDMFPNAATMRAFLQAGQVSAQIISGADYAGDSGTANVYIASFSPPVTALNDGLKLRITVGHPNSGASTFSPDGLSAAPIKTFTNFPLIGGELFTGLELELTYTSVTSSWVITSPSQATEGGPGSAIIATQALTDAIANDTTIVTPKKLGNGFSFIAAFPGRIKLPSWLGSFMMQWGQSNALSTGSNASLGFVNFGVAFTTCYWCGGFADDVAQVSGWNPITLIWNPPTTGGCNFVADTGGGSGQPITNANVHIRFLAVGKA